VTATGLIFQRQLRVYPQARDDEVRLLEKG
jgi:hypothetical protein